MLRVGTEQGGRGGSRRLEGRIRIKRDEMAEEGKEWVEEEEEDIDDGRE